jgi:hypothetical protein
MTVLTDRAQGAASMQDGSVEIMVGGYGVDICIRTHFVASSTPVHRRRLRRRAGVE